MKLIPKLISTFFITALISITHAQITGTVYRDYNGNGSRQTAAPMIEPGIPGVIVTAYNATDQVVNTTTTISNGTYSLAYSVPVRLEFTIPSGSACVNNNVDYNSFRGDGNNVRFVSASPSVQNYAINNPADYVSNTNPYVFASRFTNGNPLGGGNSGTSTWFVGYPYNSSGSGAAPKTLNGTIIGSTWGVAYSKQARKIFTAAFIKRHSGLGQLGSGGIYMLDTTATSFNVNQFFDMDAPASITLGSGRTRADAAAPAYGSGSSFTLNGANTIATYQGAIDPASGSPAGLGVVGSNVNRALPAVRTTLSYDPAAFDQVGKVGLGDLEISDDGKYLFVVNLYDRKVYRLELNNAINPTSVIAVTSYTLPATVVTNGVLRPFGIKYSRGKLFVGAVSTGENGGVINVGGTTDVYAYVFELINATASASFTATPVVTFPLNYAKGGAMTWTGPFGIQWYPWSKNTSISVGTGTNRTYPTPMLSNIEFDDRGDMIMSFCDRAGHQWSEDNYQNLATSATIVRYAVGGDVLIAGSNCNGTYTLENNGAYTSANGTSYNSGAANNQGPGTSEFFKGDIYSTVHSETTLGSLAYRKGSSELFFGTMDPLAINSGGTKRLSMTNGLEVAGSLYQLYGASVAEFGKANGLGDIEIIGTEPPIEIGNLIWNDTNGDGIQEPGEAGIAAVTLELVDATGNPVDSDPLTAGIQATFVTTDANGNWYITSATGVDVLGINYGVALLPNTSYRLRLASGAGDDWDATANGGTGGPRAGQQLVGLQLAITDKIGNGQADLSDNDAGIVSSIPQVSITTGNYGQNNHNVDFGFKALAGLGNKVWQDVDKDGIQDAGEPGMAGITITLKNNAGNVIATTVSDAYGNYLFDNLVAGNYTINITLPANYVFSSQTNLADYINGSETATDINGSDVNAAGVSYTVNLSPGERNNNMDVGLVFNTPIQPNSIGDKVWFDNGLGGGTAGNGIQDGTEPGVAGVTVTLYAADGITVISTTVTDANGNYIFTNLPVSTNYIIGVTPPAGTVFAPTTGTTPGNATTNSDVNATLTSSSYGKTTVINTGVAGTQITGIDAGLVAQATNTASLGDRVWNDLNNNGTQDTGEPGIAGVTVNLYEDVNGDNVLAGAELISVRTTVTDAFGFYIFNNLVRLPLNKWQVEFIQPAGFNNTAVANNNSGNDATDSDIINNTTDRTDFIRLKADERNTKVDAGFVSTAPGGLRLGDKVWRDDNADGQQGATEPGVAGVTAKLYQNGPDGLPGTADDVLIATRTTDIDGNYLFTNLSASVGASTNYNVQFSNLPTGFGFTGLDVGADATDNDANSLGKTGSINLVANNLTIDAAIKQGIASGLGSLGDKVWFDLDNDGIQDAGELGAAGVALNLYLDANNNGIISGAELTAVATTTTNALGEYMFGGLNAGIYQVGFTLPAALSTYTLSTIDAGTDDGVDSDGNPKNTSIAGNTAGLQTSYTALIALASGEDKLTVDLGLVPPAATNTLGGTIWFDTDSDGSQTGNTGRLAGVLVTLYNNAGVAIAYTTTDENGDYLFVGLVDGTYSVGFSNYPAGFDLTSKSVSNDAIGSDADRTSGRTATVALNAGNRNDRSLDGGLIGIRALLGDKVWDDLNGNGVQDAAEPGIAGVTVSLYFDADNNGSISGAEATTPAASAITDVNGNYLFTNLTGGNYLLGFGTLPASMEFTQQNTPGDNQNNTNSDANPATGLTSLIALANAEIDLTIDAGLRRIPIATVGNRVWDDLDGDGIQDAGEPGISGVVATLYNNLNQPIGSSVTDGNGNWLITNVPLGTGYYVIFTNKPIGNFTIQDNGGAGTGGVTDSDNDSDANSSGQTGTFDVTPNTVNVKIDAGINYSIVLPVKMTSFIAKPQDANVKLNWIVTDELNVSAYEMEFSTNGIDFVSIGSVSATNSRNYGFLHTSPVAGINYYRIKTIDYDGKISYSEIRIVNFGRAGTISIYPNPSSEIVNITVTRNFIDKPATISLIAMDGKVVLQKRINVMSQTETIDISKFATGKYLLQVLSAEGTITKAIEIIQK